jgi:hypothetical protein
MSKAANIGSYNDIVVRVDIFAECGPFKAVCDLDRDLGKEVARILDECRNAEAELLLGKGDAMCSSKRCFDVCEKGASDEPQVCTVDRISGLFECGRWSGSKAWASLVNIEAKCCGKVSQPDYLIEVYKTISNPRCSPC